MGSQTAGGGEKFGEQSGNMRGDKLHQIKSEKKNKLQSVSNDNGWEGCYLRVQSDV